MNEVVCVLRGGGEICRYVMCRQIVETVSGKFGEWEGDVV